MQTAFTAPGRFFRGNLHTHSTLSDGAITPAEVCRRYRAEGYDFIALTDHFVGLYGYPIADTVPFREDGFTTLLGAELHSGKMRNGEIWHLVAVGLPEDFAPSHSPDFRPLDDQETGAELAARARDAGAFVAIAHPQWSGMHPEDAMSIDAAHAVEIYNHSCAVEAARPDGAHMADLMLAAGRDIALIATDDAHFAGPDAFGGWILVKSPANTPEDLLSALKAGHYYATQGPELRDVRIEGDEIVVESSAVERVIVQGTGNSALCHLAESATRARVPLAKFDHSAWVRVTVMDRAGKQAWCNPIWRK